MVAGAITGNISAEATTPTGNTFAEAMRGDIVSPWLQGIAWIYSSVRSPTHRTRHRSLRAASGCAAPWRSGWDQRPLSQSSRPQFECDDSPSLLGWRAASGPVHRIDSPTSIAASLRARSARALASAQLQTESAESPDSDFSARSDRPR